jgi:hypothetical protein
MAATIVGPVATSPGLPGGVSVAINLTSAQVVKATPGICAKISCIVGGSLTLNDCTTTGAAAAANEIYSGTLTAGQVVPLNWPCALGICVSQITSAQVSIAFS